MNCVIFIILTNKHAGLDESLSLIKSIQRKHKVSLLTYDLSHYHGLPLCEEDANKIKSIIETMNFHYDSIKVNIVADEIQIKSLKKFFNDTNYDITTYVMNNAIDLTK